MAEGTYQGSHKTPLDVRAAVRGPCHFRWSLCVGGEDVNSRDLCGEEGGSVLDFATELRRTWAPPR
jgi:hypothetical protein